MLFFLSTLFGHLIVSINKQKQTVWSYALTAFLALLFYLLVIPYFSFWGAALITLAAEIGIAVILYIIVGKETGMWPNHVFAASAFASALGMFALLELLSFHWILEIAIGAAIYPVLLLGLSIDRQKILCSILGSNAWYLVERSSYIFRRVFWL